MSLHRSVPHRWSVLFRMLCSSWNCGKQDILFSASVTNFFDSFSHCSWKMSSTVYDLSTHEVYHDWMSCTLEPDSSKHREHSSQLPLTTSARRYLSSTSGATARYDVHGTHRAVIHGSRQWQVSQHPLVTFITAWHYESRSIIFVPIPAALRNEQHFAVAIFLACYIIHHLVTTHIRHQEITFQPAAGESDPFLIIREYKF